MKIRHALALALVAAAALPAAASAVVVPPPSGDNYLQPIFLNNQSTPLPYAAPVGFQADTTNYTTQADLFNPNGQGGPGGGGPPEPTACGPSVYGKTIWAVFYADKYGLAHISTAGNFDSVITVIPFTGPQSPRPQLPGECIDNLSGFEEDLTGIVVPNQWYAIQVGGTGAVQGGQIQIKLQIDTPPTVNGDAVLSWNSGSSGVRIKSLVVSGGPGEFIGVTCTHHGCGKNPKIIRAAGGPLLKRIGAVGPATAFNPAVHAAAKSYKLLAGRKVKAGTKIEVKIVQPGFIGKDFSWNVSRSGVGTKVQRCINPGSTVPRKKCP